MLQVALSQVRMHARRFIAVGLAVMLAVGFLTATLTVNATTTASLKQSLGESYAAADVVITPENFDASITDQDLNAVSELDQVDASYGQLRAVTEFETGSETGNAALTSVAPKALETTNVVSGQLPETTGQVSVDQATADEFNLAVGDQVTLQPAGAQAGKGDGGTEVTIAGIVESTNNPLAAAQPQFQATGEQLKQLGEAVQPTMQAIQLSLAPGATPDAAVAAVEDKLSGEPVVVRTAEEQVVADVAELTGGTDQFTVVLLAFAIIAVLVSGLVIANTFSVLLAQRTRELALMRCVGAGRAQIRRSVLIEAFVVALVSSALGVLLAVGVMFGLVSWAQTLPGSGFATLAVPPSAVITGMVVGILITLIAALAPARSATAVAPLAALRPVEDLSVGSKRGKVRLGIGLFLLVSGAVLLISGAYLSQLLIAVPGGALTFLGFLLCSSFFVPKVVSAFGRLAAPLGVPGKLAAVNSVRNPGRTSTTSAALLIGVTLVTMMMAGAETAKHTFDAKLDERFPVDMSITGPSGQDQPLNAAAVTAAERVDGVEQAVLLPVAGTIQDGADDAAATEKQDTGVSSGGSVGGPEQAQLPGNPVYAIDPADARAVLNDEDVEVADSTIIMPNGTNEETVTIVGEDGEVTLDVVTSDTERMVPVVSTTVLETVGGPMATPGSGAGSGTGAGAGSGSGAGAGAGSSAGSGAGAGSAWMPQVWLSVESGMTSGELVDLRSAVADAVGVDDFQVSGAVVQRAMFNQIIDVMLLVVTALLGVAVLIALIGVANTLSLSVLERTRESSLLRALGLTRGQLRMMLAVEAVLIAGVAALIGIGLGTAFGWLGAQSALGLFATVTPQLPWLQVAGVLAVAIAAGLLASVVPARRAARLSPVEGLAME
ncbi:ABC transporter permease [Arthrobacter castelli]|uniref:ABC transporter permease n=1 Tax=Arthrobacter castelli TaxID=271431 RepID=UPI0003FCDB7F|nr:FtsX-like permease family protein [Arthrobacter castelli]